MNPYWPVRAPRPDSASRMEQDSLEQDSSLRDYWKKKEKKMEKQGKKERKRKEAKGRDSVDRVTGTDQKRMDNKASETLDPSCLISTTSPAGGTNHKEQINTSEHITTDEGEPVLNSPDNAYLRAFNEIYGSSPETRGIHTDKFCGRRRGCKHGDQHG